MTSLEQPRLRHVVIRSAKRKKTAQAAIKKGVLEIRIPGRSTAAEEQEFVSYFLDRFERQRDRSSIDLAARAKVLARSHGLEQPSSIAWVSNQEQRWGSCTPAHRTVRISDRMANFPLWVIDYVIVHELAHLSEPDHGERFWEIVNRYPFTERARGYLIAKSEGDHDESSNAELLEGQTELF